MNLDVSRLPQEAFVGEGSARMRLESIPARLSGVVDDMARAGLIKANMSFGCAFAKPAEELSWVGYEDWNDPYSFVWFVAGWGPDRDRYIANAVRKLRASLREDKDTLTLRIKCPGAFVDVVNSVDEDGSFPWGDFPWGGATFVHVGDIVIPTAVSCLREVEDDAIAKLLGGLVGAESLKIKMPEEFGPNS